MANCHKDECQITCEGGNGTKLLSQEIPFTDFPFDITIWKVEGTCLLPGDVSHQTKVD
jgi:hypothetical protein